MMASVPINQGNTGGTTGGTPVLRYNSTTVKSDGEEASSAKASKEDTVTLSQEGLTKATKESSPSNVPENENNPKNKDGNSLELTPEELTELQKLKQRDLEVRTHEQAHMAAAGRYSKGGPSFSLEKGPDGRSYAVGGEVGIDVGKAKTPEETVAKMRIIKQAALAPANPSSADRRIAAQASIKESQARQEMLIYRKSFFNLKNSLLLTDQN